jgi:hypothetical protein
MYTKEAIFEIETKLISKYDRTECTCRRDTYKICHYHKLIYCLICDGFLCPKCGIYFGVPPLV